MIGDLILTEVLQGFHRDREFRIARDLLLRIPFMPMLGQELALESAANYRLLRRKGATVRKTIDVMIGSFCIHYRIPTFTATEISTQWWNSWALMSLIYSLPRHVPGSRRTTSRREEACPSDCEALPCCSAKPCLSPAIDPPGLVVRHEGASACGFVVDDGAGVSLAEGDGGVLQY
jgi:hypothetical protein